MQANIRHIIKRTVTAPFYKEHAGFFLFLFLLLLGTQRSFADAVLFHTAIIKSILSIHYALQIALLAWIVYGIKVLHFYYKTVTHPRYSFLQTLNCMPLRYRFVYILYQQAILLLPANLYFLLVISVGWCNHLYDNMLIVFAAGIVIWLGSSFIVVYLLHKAGSYSNSLFTQKVMRLFPGNLVGFLLKFCTQHIFLSLCTIKLVSFICLYGLSRLETDVYEQRILWMIYISVLVGHGVIVYRLHTFIETGLSFLRNMPLPVSRLVLSLFTVYCIILLPEAWALKSVAIYQHQVADYIWLVIFGPCFLLLLHSLLYTDQQKLEGYFGLLFGIWIVFVFFSLSPQRLYMTGFALLLTVVCFYTGYYKYEPLFNQTNDKA